MDIVTIGHATELAGHTLSLLGHAIFTDARAVGEIIDPFVNKPGPRERQFAVFGATLKPNGAWSTADA
ncbi:hypothetical protein HDE78_000586 [Rhodanobacter sp. K2T2]|uniref:hypothetical protein n=1 Tax=Rhodanobacter sp. K2T2 TaxID=2723085 RepID=UPI0015C7FA0C|nr:hypothetical protein [Rhodanobacter sp. K2T2]NYE27661.1 hypothetical protein [Rhodanobacter sp. K2T2]